MVYQRILNIVPYAISVSQLSRSVVSDSVTPWIAARQASLSITNSQSSLRLTSIESVMPSSRLILCRPLLLLPPIPPSIRVFSSESAPVLHSRTVLSIYSVYESSHLLTYFSHSTLSPSSSPYAGHFNPSLLASTSCAPFKGFNSFQCHKDVPIFSLKMFKFCFSN